MILREGTRVVHNEFDWNAALLDLRVGSPAHLHVRRGSREFDVDVAVADLPEVTAPKVQVLRELELVTVTPTIASERGLRRPSARSSTTSARRSADADRHPAGRRHSYRSTIHMTRTAEDVASAIDRYGGRMYLNMTVDRKRPVVSDHLRRPMNPHLRYSSPLAERYASTAMLELWSPATRHGLWRQLWLALAEAERELGVPIPDEALAQMRAHLDDVDFDAVAAYERRFRHDVMAHVHAFGDVAPAARPFIHYGATSAFVTDNADLILMRRGLLLLRAKLVRSLRALAAFAREWRAEPTLGYTHLQPAQPTTVGKRATLWMQDLVLDIAELDHRIAHAALPRRQGHDRDAGELPRDLRRRPRQGRRARRARHRARWASPSRFRSPARRTRESSTRRCSTPSPASPRRR